MNLFKSYTKTTLTLLIALSFVIFTSCSNPAGTDGGPHHHHEKSPVGLVLFMNGEQIAKYHEGHVHGKIHATAGRETSLITVKFIAKDGDLFQPHEPNHFWGWEVANTSIAKVEQHADDGTWKFHVIGKKTGETEVVLKMLHGAKDNHHPHLTSKPIPIHVIK